LIDAAVIRSGLFACSTKAFPLKVRMRVVASFGSSLPIQVAGTGTVGFATCPPIMPARARSFSSFKMV